MKSYHLFILISTAAILVLPACGQWQTDTEKIKDNVNDVLDRWPDEKVLDAGEDASDKIKEVGKDIKESVKDAAN